MNLNVFAWIREGVRMSVLAGVSDAIEQLGTPADGDELRPRIAEYLRRRNALLENPAAPEGRPRRLGRSLKDLDGGQETK